MFFFSIAVAVARCVLKTITSFWRFVGFFVTYVHDSKNQVQQFEDTLKKVKVD